jgi:pyruvate/2-oxoglutarate dehydrogenase complex dihydrolipoamide dehydrogenase (E3) component
VTAAGGAALGLSVALVEREALGGDCLWSGCVPSKALVAAGKLAYRMRHAEALGLRGASPAHALESVMDRMDDARRRIARHDDPQRFRDLGVEVVFGRAEVRAPGVVEVEGRRLETARLVIATGASAAIPSIPGLTEAGCLTHRTALERRRLPAHLVVIGGGPVGVELAQVYRRLGADVTVLEMLPQLLPREEPEAAETLRQVLEAEGVAVRTGTRVERVEPSTDGRHRVLGRGPAGEPVEATGDAILVATGRRPNGAGLGLEALGVAVVGGAVVVDRRLRAGVPGVWAAGDVVGGPQFTHVAEYHAKLVLRNAVFPFPGAADYTAVPAVTYSDPEVARVGLAETEARHRHGVVEVYRYPFADLDRAIVDGADEGFVKVITRRRGRIVGATVVGSGAGELVVPFVLAIEHGIALPKLARIVYPYPTMSEGIKRAANEYYRARLAGRSGAWLRKVVRWLA